MKLEEYIFKRKKEDGINEFDLEKRTENTRICVNYVFEYFNNYLDTKPADEKTVLHEQKIEKYRNIIRDYDSEVRDWLTSIYASHGKYMHKQLMNLIMDDYFLLYDSDYEFRALSYELYPKAIKKFKFLEGQSEMIFQFIKEAHKVRNQFAPCDKDLYISDSINEWINDTYKKHGVNIYNFCYEWAHYFYEYPDIWPKGHKQISGLLRRRMVALSHQNLPLAMFLEVSDLGYPAWKGSTSKAASNADIKSSLGLGVVRFTELPQSPEIVTQDYEYRVNTEVITAVTVSGGQSDPDNPTKVSYSIDGKTYNVGNVYYPQGDSQLAWVKWTTPDTEQDMVIHVSVEGPGGTDKTTIHCKIVDLDKNTPPNPVADDRNDSFLPVSVPKRSEMTRVEWSVWDPWWQEYWVWHSTGEDSGYWCDHGWWEFDLDKYYARFSANMSIRCDSKNPTASGGVMKSGYGINETVTASVSSNQSSAITYPQTAVSYFPEFGYKTYWRLLERMKGDSSASFEFQKNKYSTYKNRTHFTPIWMPDGVYIVNTWVADSWTPVGMLSVSLTDSLTIKGNLWQDWHVAPLKP